MQTTSLLCFAIVLVVALYSLPLSAEPAKKASDVATTTLGTTTKKVSKPSEKAPVPKPASKTAKKQPEKPRYKSYS